MHEKDILTALGIVALYALWALVRLAESERANRHLQGLLRALLRRPMAERLFLALFVAMLIAHGGSKTNGVPEQSVTPPGLEQEVEEQLPAMDGESWDLGGGGLLAGLSEGGARLTSNQYAAGFALVRVLTNAAPWAAAPSNAVVHAPWGRYGLAEDTFWLPATNWAFVLGTNAVEGAHVSSSGTLSFDPETPKGSPHARELPDNDAVSFLAPLQACLGTVPPGGRFWHAPTASNSVLMTWQDVFAGRDTNAPVTFQTELFWNGDFACRYAFTNALALTNFVVGAQHNLGGETYAFGATNLLCDALELRWRAFGMLDPGVDDHDGDGLSTYDEVMTCGTDPSLKDSDRDGLDDDAELAAGVRPLLPDSDADGLADGIAAQPGVWNDPDATNGLDGLAYIYKVQHGLDPAADNSVDSDGDGWADWKELLAGTATNSPSSMPVGADNVPALFDATITLAADLPCPVVLNVGGHTLALLKAGSWKLTLPEGVAHGLVITAARPCHVSLSVSLASACAAVQDASGVFTGGAQLPGGRPVDCGLIAQPTVAIVPDRVCFHSDAPKTLAAVVTPPMAGAYQWLWYGGELSSATGRHANISWETGDAYVYLNFTAAGATQARGVNRTVTRCSKGGEDTWCDDHGCEHWFCACDDFGACDDDDCGLHGRKVAKCREAVCPTHNCPYSECPEGWCHLHGVEYDNCGEWWCHMHDCDIAECEHGWYDPATDPESGYGAQPDPDPGEPVFGACDELLVAVNNDDDDASAVEDSGESPVQDENDLVAVWPLGRHDGQCCTCAEHQIPPGGSTEAEIESCSTRLALYTNAVKTAVFGDTVSAGQSEWEEGQTASTSVGADHIVWKWTDEDNLVHRVTNAFTVLSVRLFGDVNLDGQVDAADKALHPTLSHEYGWCMPAATNVYRPILLLTDVGLSGGVYTLSLSGDAGAFRVWPDASGTNDAPLLACGQTVTNGEGGVTFLAGEETALYVEAVSNGTATLTYAYAGAGDAAGIACQAKLKMTAWAIEFVHAEGDEVGQPMEGLPVFTPCSGTGKGVPIYDSPYQDLTVVFSAVLNTNGTRSAELTYLGCQYAVMETAPDSLVFTNVSVSASFSNTLLSDTNVAEILTATLTLPALGITNAVYACTETDAASLVFQSGPHGIVASISGLSASVPDTMNIQVSSLYSSRSWDLTETAPDSRNFAGSGLVLRLAGSPSLTSGADTLLLSLSDYFGLTNTILTVFETGAQTQTFRNYDPPVPTDTEDVPVPDFAPWRLKIPGIANPALISSIALTTAVDRVEQITFSASGNDLVSDQTFILAPDRTFDAEIPAGYQPLRIDDTASKWQDAAAQGVGVEVTLYAMASPVTKSKKEKPGAVVLQSLDWFSSAGQGLDPENRIRKPLLEMGYSAIKDYKASVSQTLSDYVKGKQIWYSMSHGGTENGTPYTAFNGLLFRDGAIRASNLEPLDLNYKLAIVDGCCSAQTVLTSEQDARNIDTLSPTCQAFADSFGPDSAYMGWSWKMEPNSAQTWSSEFVDNLNFDALKGRGLTVAEAHEKFLTTHNDPNDKKYAPAARNMKIYGAVDNVIDTRKAADL